MKCTSSASRMSARTGTSRIHSLPDLHAVFIFAERSCRLLEQYPNSFIYKSFWNILAIWARLDCNCTQLIVPKPLSIKFICALLGGPKEREWSLYVLICLWSASTRLNCSYLSVVTLIYFLYWQASRSSLETRYLEDLILVPSFWDFLFWKWRHRQHPWLQPCNIASNCFPTQMILHNALLTSLFIGLAELSCFELRSRYIYF